MKIKTFRHNKIEECGLCNKIIHTDKDNWCLVADFAGDKLEKIKFYHRFCLTDLIQGQGKVITKNFQDKVNATVKNLLKGISVRKINENTDDKKEIVVEIK